MFQHPLDDVMIVAIAGIDGDIAPIRLTQRCIRVFGGGVTDSEGNDAAGFGPEGLRVAALFNARLHPFHRPVMALCNKSTQAGLHIRAKLRRAEAHGIESQMPGMVLDPFLKGASGAGRGRA